MEREPWRPFFVAATELGRFTLFRRLSALFPGLFLLASRRRRPTHATTILARIAAQPGIHYDGLRRELRLGNGVLAHHLHALERQRHIRRRRAGMHVRFYPMASPTPPALSLDATASRVAALVAQRPGISQSAMARHLGTSRQLVHHHVRRLEDLGLVSLERHGRTSLVWLVPEAAARVRQCRRCGVTHAWQNEVPPDPQCPRCGVFLGQTGQRRPPEPLNGAPSA